MFEKCGLFDDFKNYCVPVFNRKQIIYKLYPSLCLSQASPLSLSLCVYVHDVFTIWSSAYNVTERGLYFNAKWPRDSKLFTVEAKNKEGQLHGSAFISVTSK